MKHSSFLRIFFVLIVFGLIGLLSFIGSPAMADVRAVDVVRLIGAGMCIGGAIVALSAHLHGRQSK